MAYTVVSSTNNSVDLGYFDASLDPLQGNPSPYVGATGHTGPDWTTDITGTISSYAFEMSPERLAALPEDEQRRYSGMLLYWKGEVFTFEEFRRLHKPRRIIHPDLFAKEVAEGGRPV